MGLILVAEAQTLSTNLPVTEISGTEYYYYEVGKDESLYAIANKFGWNLDELLKANPEAGSDLKAGTKLYYPTGRQNQNSETTAVNVTPSQQHFSQVTYPPIIHKVKKGETIYGISKQYDLPLETIYELYPETMQGVKPGTVLIFNQNPETVANGFLFYEVKKGDKLSTIAETYGISIDDIKQYNEWISKEKIKKGQILRLRLDSSPQFAELWAQIQQAKNEADSIAQRILNEDTNILTQENIASLITPAKLDSITIAVILGEPKSKKDIEFTRGFLLALKKMGNPGYKINLQVLNGTNTEKDILVGLDTISPNLIVTTADKSYPAYLADYGNNNNIEIINVFDVKNDLYLNNNSMVQLLPPSDSFNSIIVDGIYKRNSNKELLLVGKEDDVNGLSDMLTGIYTPGKTRRLTIDDLNSFEPEEGQEYVIYAYDSKKDNISKTLKALTNLQEKAAGKLTVIGRPNWIVYAESFKKDFSLNNIIIPSRVWLNKSDISWKDFCTNYKELYGSSPVESIPNYAASGYDIANYFIPLTVEYPGTPIPTGQFETIPLFQSYFNLSKAGEKGGYMNKVAYLLQFDFDGDIKKILIED